jgi:hypothetical protein
LGDGSWVVWGLFSVGVWLFDYWFRASVTSLFVCCRLGSGLDRVIVLPADACFEGVGLHGGLSMEMNRTFVRLVF